MSDEKWLERTKGVMGRPIHYVLEELNNDSRQAASRKISLEREPQEPIETDQLTPTFCWVKAQYSFNRVIISTRLAKLAGFTR